MEKRRETIDDSVKDYAAEQRRSLDGHPDVEQLAAYHRGELPEETREEIQEHLTFCEECARLVLDLEDFAKLEPPSEEYRLSETDVETQKQALKDRIQEEEEPTAKLLTFSRRERRPREGAGPSIPWWYHGLAAALLGACLGLVFWEVSRQTVGERPPSGINPRVETLFPASEGFRGAESQEAMQVPPGSDLVLVLLLLEDQTSFPDYRVEIHDEEGRLLWTSDGFQPSSEGQFSLIFPRSLPKHGSYRLELFGLRGDEPEPLAEYPLALVEGELRRSP